MPSGADSSENGVAGPLGAESANAVPVPTRALLEGAAAPNAGAFDVGGGEMGEAASAAVPVAIRGDAGRAGGGAAIAWGANGVAGSPDADDTAIVRWSDDGAGTSGTMTGAGKLGITLGIGDTGVTAWRRAMRPGDNGGWPIAPVGGGAAGAAGDGAGTPSASGAGVATWGVGGASAAAWAAEACSAGASSARK